MATLDYALLAEYARIDPAGMVTIVGGSFDRVQASSTSGVQQTYVVIRVLLDKSEEAVAFEVSVGPPNKTYARQLAGTAKRNPAAVPVDGRVGVTLAIGLMVPIVAAGRYVVRVSLEGQPVQGPDTRCVNVARFQTLDLIDRPGFGWWSIPAVLTSGSSTAASATRPSSGTRTTIRSSTRSWATGPI